MANQITKSKQQIKQGRPANPPARLAFRLQSKKQQDERGRAQQKHPQQLISHE